MAPRVAFQLDETLLEGGEAFASGLLPRKLFAPVALRLGTPELLRFFASRGWEVWIHTGPGRPSAAVRLLFALHGLHVSGVVDLASGAPHDGPVALFIGRTPGLSRVAARLGAAFIQVSPTDATWTSTVRQGFVALGFSEVTLASAG